MSSKNLLLLILLVFFSGCNLQTAFTNKGPIANIQTITTNEDTGKDIVLEAVDPEGDTLTYTIVTNPIHGTLSGTAPSLTYTPESNYNGDDSFSFKVNDGNVDSNEAKVSITILAVNDAPVANSDTAVTDEGIRVYMRPLSNDTDTEGDTISIQNVSSSSSQGGAVSYSGDTILYTPKSGFTGDDDFTYTISDGNGGTATGSVAVKVNSISLDVLQEFGIDGDELREASDLEFDPNSKIMYLVGDKGTLYQYETTLIGDTISLSYTEEDNITDPIENDTSIDSEGLTYDGDSNLILSLEGTPRVTTIDVNGALTSNIDIPADLADSSTYSSSNGMFEAVTYHGQYGILLAAEFPRNGKANTEQAIYSLDGKKWNFKAESYANSAVTGLEVLEDGNILVLERAQDESDNNYMYITIKKIYLKSCDSGNNCQGKVLYNERNLAKNFEGITKISGDKYLIVADNQHASFNGVYLDTNFIYMDIHP